MADRDEQDHVHALQLQYVRAAAPALLAALRRTWEVIDAAGISTLARGVELGPTVWFVKAEDARRASLAAIAEATPPQTARGGRTVDSLQRELLAVARGGRFAAAWRQINGLAEVPNLRGEMEKLERVRELRAQIFLLDPNAALYYGWGGHGDIDPRQAARHAAHMEETMRLFGPKEND